MKPSFLSLLPLVILLCALFSSGHCKRSRKSRSGKEKGVFYDIYLPYRCEFMARMKLTTIFPRKFMYTLKDYVASKEQGKAVVSMPNYSSGALCLGSVWVSTSGEQEVLMKLVGDLAKRVFRTGLNPTTMSGNFRLAMTGLHIDKVRQYVFTQLDTNYSTDSHRRFVTFVKSFYHRLSTAGLDYRVAGEIKLDQLVLGRMEKMEAVNEKIFREKFENWFIGFSMFDRVVVKWQGDDDTPKLSIYYFDHVPHKSVVGIERGEQTPP